MLKRIYSSFFYFYLPCGGKNYAKYHAALTTTVLLATSYALIVFAIDRAFEVNLWLDKKKAVPILIGLNLLCVFYSDNLLDYKRKYNHMHLFLVFVLELLGIWLVIYI